MQFKCTPHSQLRNTFILMKNFTFSKCFISWDDFVYYCLAMRTICISFSIDNKSGQPISIRFLIFFCISTCFPWTLFGNDLHLMPDIHFYAQQIAAAIVFEKITFQNLCQPYHQTDFNYCVRVFHFVFDHIVKENEWETASVCNVYICVFSHSKLRCRFAR